MNRTLYACGFEKEAELRSGQLYDNITATLPKSVKLKNKSLKCNICQEFFSGKKYLDTHMRFKHNSELSGLSSTDRPHLSESSFSNVDRNVSDADIDMPEGDTK